MQSKETLSIIHVIANDGQKNVFKANDELKGMKEFVAKLSDEFEQIEIVFAASGQTHFEDVFDDQKNFINKLTDKNAEQNVTLKLVTANKFSSFQALSQLGLENSLGDKILLFNQRFYQQEVINKKEAKATAIYHQNDKLSNPDVIDFIGQDHDISFLYSSDENTKPNRSYFLVNELYGDEQTTVLPDNAFAVLTNKTRVNEILESEANIVDLFVAFGINNSIAVHDGVNQNDDFEIALPLSIDKNDDKQHVDDVLITYTNFVEKNSSTLKQLRHLVLIRKITKHDQVNKILKRSAISIIVFIVLLTVLLFLSYSFIFGKQDSAGKIVTLLTTGSATGLTLNLMMQSILQTFFAVWADIIVTIVLVQNVSSYVKQSLEINRLTYRVQRLTYASANKKSLVGRSNVKVARLFYVNDDEPEEANAQIQQHLE